MPERPYHQSHKSYGPQAKLNIASVRKIKDLYATGEYTHQQLGEMFGVHASNIGRAINDIHFQPFDKE